MDIDALYQKLILAARKAPTSEAVPYAFEKRIMAHLSPLKRFDPWASWSRALWRSAFMCALISRAVGGWSYASISQEASPEAVSLEFETTVFTPMDRTIGEMW